MALNNDSHIMRMFFCKQIHVDVVQTNLVEALLPRLQLRLDVLIFNPPYACFPLACTCVSLAYARTHMHSYVPTPDEEVGRRDLTAAWAGGKDGRVVLDRLLPLLPRLLSPTGAFYLVAMRANKPLGRCSISLSCVCMHAHAVGSAEIVEMLETMGFGAEVRLLTDPNPFPFVSSFGAFRLC